MRDGKQQMPNPELLEKYLYSFTMGSRRVNYCSTAALQDCSTATPPNCSTIIDDPNDHKDINDLNHLNPSNGTNRINLTNQKVLDTAETMTEYLA